MTDFSPARLAELRAVAESATEGPWGKNGSLFQVAETGSGIGQVWGLNWRSDLAHIAAFDPPTVLALIAALEAMTAEVEALAKEALHALPDNRLGTLSHFIAALEQERDESRAALAAAESAVGDLEVQLARIGRQWRATGRAEADAHRRAARAEAALGRFKAPSFTNHLYFIIMSDPSLNNDAGEVLYDRIIALIRDQNSGT